MPSNRPHGSSNLSLLPVMTLGYANELEKGDEEGKGLHGLAAHGSYDGDAGSYEGGHNAAIENGGLLELESPRDSSAMGWMSELARLSPESSGEGGMCMAGLGRRETW